MPVDFTPVEITVYRPVHLIQKFLTKLPPADFKCLTPQCTLFLTPETAKRFMRRFNRFDVLIKGCKDHDFAPCRAKPIEKPKIKRSQLTKFKRKKFPEYIYCSIDGKRGFRCLTHPGGYIMVSGQKIKLSGRKWRGTDFYTIFEE